MSTETIQFFTVPKAWGNLSMSPFCGKLHAWLALSGHDFKVRTANLQKAPNGKIPYIQHGGRTLGDSSKIIGYLAETLGDPLDGALSEDEWAMGHMLQRLCEESLYWHVVYLRWATDEGFAHVRAELARMVPAVLMPVVSRMARRKAVKQLYAQGTLRHDLDHICGMGMADLEALATLFGDGPFLFGETPTSYDACLYAFVSSALRMPYENPLTAHARTLTTLVDFVERMDARIGHDPAA